MAHVPSVPSKLPFIKSEVETKVEKSRKEIVTERIQEILKEYDGLESNIPATKGHEYWNLLNELRSLK